MNLKELGEMVNAHRESKGLSMYKLAKDIDVSYNTIMKVMKGTAGNYNTINKVCGAVGLELTVKELSECDKEDNVKGDKQSIYEF